MANDSLRYQAAEDITQKQASFSPAVKPLCAYSSTLASCRSPVSASIAQWRVTPPAHLDPSAIGYGGECVAGVGGVMQGGAGMSGKDRFAEFRPLIWHPESRL